MTSRRKLGLLFLHPLPLDGSMWAGQSNLQPDSTYMPTLYPLGDDIEEWAVSALKQVKEEYVVVVGCSIGGSCALEVAAIAPERIAALVLIGTKANHRPDPVLHASVIETIKREGLEAAWEAFWAPLFSKSATAFVKDAAKRIFLRQSAEDIAKGVTAFHTRSSRDQILSSFPGPITIVSGVEDIAPGPEVSAAQSESAQRGRLCMIPDCGHYVPLEKPESLNVILRDVLDCGARP